MSRVVGIQVPCLLTPATARLSKAVPQTTITITTAATALVTLRLTLGNFRPVISSNPLMCQESNSDYESSVHIRVTLSLSVSPFAPNEEDRTTSRAA